MAKPDKYMGNKENDQNASDEQIGEDLDNAETAKPVKDVKTPRAQLVQMVRNSDIYPAPHTCDVHEDEVNNYALGGWVNAN